ncbi:MobF family relaxase [Trichlorobacter lovleyi]|uniref:MobF family relaxase n=1 Tax=Trichlorobacter lovleyi TaxID=313985 RepID=UPI003D14B604
MKPDKVSVAKAEQYYYTRDAVYQQSDARYLGTGAAALGIEGKGIGEEFSLLIRGFSPDGEKLAQRKNLSDEEAIAGTDLPLTLPKSWSVLALVDPELRQAALESAKTVIQAIEANGWIEGRQTLDGKTERVTAKMLAAAFPHFTSRENDAHVHVHAVFHNMVQRQDGSWSTLENHCLFEHSKEIRQMFLADFAASEVAQKYGIELTIDRGGTVVPEVAGFSDEAKELFSKRHNEIHNADALRTRLQEKMPHLNKEDLDTLVQLSTRSAKNKDLTEADLLKSHREQLAVAGLPTLEQMRDNAIALKSEQSSERQSTVEYVKQAAEDLSEHQSVFSHSELLQAALKQSIGYAAPADIEKAIMEATASRQIVGYSQDKFTTPEIHQIEGQVAKVAVEQREAFSPLLQDNQVKDVIERFQEKKGFTLTRGQADAVGYVLQHTGRIGVIQGDAGAGKSSSMEAVADTIKAIGAEQGVSVRGFTLQGKTSVMLQGDSGIESQTIDSFLNSKSTWNSTDRQLWIVDEYSMVDSRRLAGLVERAEQENAQVILLGDKKQLAAISAGRLGQDLDENGLVKTVHMDESLRQKTEYAQAVDAAMKRGDVRTALEVMEKAGKIHYIADRQERAEAMAKAFVEKDQVAREATNGKKGALSMTLTNVERETVIREVRHIQKAVGIIGQEDHTFITRAPVAVDTVTRKLAASYAVGQISIPSKEIGEIKSGSEARITAVDTVKNTLTLEFDGKSETIDARKQTKGLMIYEERQTHLSEGEKIAWLKTDNSAQGKHNKIKNGLTGTIDKIEGDTLTVKTQLGHTVQIQGQDAYITNAQAITGHKAQGATEHTGLMSISADDRLATQNMLYVLTTRQTHDLVAFVDDKEKLIENLRSETKASSLEEQRDLLKELTQQLRSTVDREQELSQQYAKAANSLSWIVDGMGQNRATDRQRIMESEQQLDGGGDGRHQSHQERGTGAEMTM